MNRRSNESVTTLPVVHTQPGSELVAHDPFANAFVPEDQLDLREMWRVIVKYKGTILTVLSLIVFVTVTATLLMRPVYRSTALLEIKPDRGNMVKFQNLEQVYRQPEEYKTTQQNILRSESVAEAVIQQLDLANNPEISGVLNQRGFISGIKQIGGALGVKKILTSITGNDQEYGADGQVESEGLNPEHVARIRMLQRFRDRLTVAPIPGSDLFEVSFDSFDPLVASRVANAAVEQYIRLNQERRFNSTSGAKVFLEKEISKVQAGLESSEKDLTEFARRHQIIDVEDRGNIMNTRLSELSTKLTEVNAKRMEAEAMYAQSQSEYGIEVLPSILNNDLIQKLKQSYSDLQGEFFKLSRIYKPAYPKLQQVAAELNQVKTGLDIETKRVADGLRTSFEQLKKREVLLEEQLQVQKTDLLSLKDRSIQYNILKREWETNKELYTGLLERMKEVGVASGMEINNIAMIDRAETPITKYSPKLSKNVAIAIMLGLIAGVGLAFLLAYLDNTIRTPEELERVAGITSLGLVPIDIERKKKNSRGKGDSRRELTPGLDLSSHLERDSNISEAFRSIRTSLMFSTPSGLPKVLMVTSADMGEGKTTIATNLAIVLADNGARVLLVDGDLRKPRIHKIFKVPSTPGLTEYLVSEQDRPESHATEIENLYLLTSGTPPPNPAELLGSAKMDRFMEQATEFYDHIIIDSAPLLGLADSVITSTKVDGVICTVLVGHISREAIREGVKRLRRVHAPLLGAILNQVNLSEKGYGHYGHYYYQETPETDESSDVFEARA